MAVTGLLVGLLGIVWQVFCLLILGALIYLFVLAVKALRKYLASGPARKEKAETVRSLGESLKQHRM